MGHSSLETSPKMRFTISLLVVGILIFLICAATPKLYLVEVDEADNKMEIETGKRDVTEEMKIFDVNQTEDGTDYSADDYPGRSEACPTRGNVSRWSPEYKILPASGNFRDITTRNWAYCAFLCKITTEPERCLYWAWNRELQGDPAVGPPGTCILLSGIDPTQLRQDTGIIHGSSRCQPGNDF